MVFGWKMIMTPPSIFTSTWRSFHFQLQREMFTIHCFHFQLQREMGTTHSPIFLSTNFIHSFHSFNSTQTYKDASLMNLTRYYFLFILINCFCCLHLVDFGYSILVKIVKTLEPNIVTFATLIDVLCEEGKISRAVDLFNDVVAGGYQSDVTTYSVIVNAVCKCGKTNLEQRHKGVSPNVITYTRLIHGPCNLGKLNLTLALLNEMVGRTYYQIYNALMDGYCLKSQMIEARKVFDQMLSRQVDRKNCSVFLDGLCNREFFVTHSLFKSDGKESIEASSLFENGLQPDVYTYSTMITGIWSEGLLDEACRDFGGMEVGRRLPHDCCYFVFVSQA
uniref:Pentatricopeptide repeat-containing protein n=1 Tax=Manihot esculenta TaxID=3983 RepID=A0A199UCQ9_MANES